jgi:hypothetical protein
MAQVASDAKLGEWIDEYLVYLTRAWKGIPQLAAEWEEWDEHSRLVFDLNWAVPEDRLLQLRHWAEQGLLTPAQCTRYQELLKLVEKNRPTLERLLAD